MARIQFLFRIRGVPPNSGALRIQTTPPNSERWVNSDRPSRIQTASNSGGVFPNSDATPPIQAGPSRIQAIPLLKMEWNSIPQLHNLTAVDVET